jgi:hypothetical protein
MKKACPCLAGLVALALALAAVPAPVRAQPKEVPVAPPPHDVRSPYAHTALGALIEANGGKIPGTGTELTTALAKLGNFAQLPVSFSAVALHSALAHPRVIITTRQSAPPAGGSCPNMGSPQIESGWGGTMRGIDAIPLGAAPANKPYLHGRLFLAANTELSAARVPVIKTVEFISWNSRKQKFDFGVIEGMGDKPEVKMFDGARCFSCHKNKGPILGVAPWSNTAQNDLVRSAAAPFFTFGFRLDSDGKEDEKLGRRNDIDGLRFLVPNGPEVDVAVRLGADVLRDRDRFRMLVRTGEGRRALVMLLGAIAARGALDERDRKLKHDLNHSNLITFIQDVHAANKTLAPSTLADFNPAAPVNRPGPNAALVNQVTRYDAARAGGDHGLPSEHQPSNPRAFLRPTGGAILNPSQLVSAVGLARALGLSEDDRTFLADSIDEARKALGDPALTSAALAKSVFTGPSFADALKTGVLPERDDFKDRVAEGLVEILRARQKADQFRLDRTRYTSAPKFDPNAAAEKEVAVVPSHACLGCHDVRKPGKAVFTPIPQLAFDPFDVTAREAWLTTADRKRKIEVLGRMVKRLTTDKDMPPEDSTERELYGVKDPAALNEVKDWLEAELRKVK